MHREFNLKQSAIGSSVMTEGDWHVAHLLA